MGSLACWNVSRLEGFKAILDLVLRDPTLIGVGQQIGHEAADLATALLCQLQHLLELGLGMDTAARRIWSRSPKSWLNAPSFVSRYTNRDNCRALCHASISSNRVIVPITPQLSNIQPSNA